MSIKNSIAIMIVVLFLGFATTAFFVTLQYNQTTKEVENRIFSELSRKAILKSELVRGLILNWKKNTQTAKEDTTIQGAAESLLTGFQKFKPKSDDLEEQKEKLKNYLRANYIKTLEARQAVVDLEQLIPKNSKAITLQNEFLVDNQLPKEEKQNFLIPPNDQSEYAVAHESYHPFLQSLMVQAEAEDLLLIDIESGNVFYSVQKEIDFAAGLQSGYLAKSNLASLYHNIKNNPKSDSVNSIDFAFYIPSLAEPRLFMGVPLNANDNKASSVILVLKFGLSKINTIMQELGSNEELVMRFEDQYIVGSDLLMHSNSRLFADHPESYLSNLEKAETPPKILEKIKAYNSTALILKVDYPAVLQGLTGTQGFNFAKDSSHNELLIGFAPIDLPDFNLVTILTMDKNEALKPIFWVTFKIISTVLALFFLILLFSLFLLRINLKLEGLVVEKTKNLNEKNIALNDTLISLMQTQEQLTQSEKLVSNVINSMPYPMIILNEKEEIILWNNEAEKEPKITFEQAKGQPLVSVFPLFKQYENKITLANQIKEPQKIDKITVKKSDQTRYLEVLIYPLLSETIIGSAILMLDITERIKLGENVQQQDKLASIGVLTAGVAHEINNPINFITGNIQALKNDFNDIISLLKSYFELNQTMSLENLQSQIKTIEAEKDTIDAEYTIEEIQKLLKGIEEGGQRTASIVKDLRTFSRLDESDMKKADIHEGINSTLTLLSHNFKNRIQIVKDYQQLPEIDCFPGKLNQVFMNIFSNAIHAIKDQGTIWIKTERVKDSIVIKIRDSGSGIPEENIKKVFEPFFTTKDVGKGTGLGLSISYSIINEHGGTITVASEVGVGTEFTITLPIKFKPKG